MGRLYSDFAEKSGLRREHFDLMVQGLVRAGYLRSAVRSFVKDGRTISYRTLAISTRGRITAAHEWAQVALAAPVLASHGRPAKVKKRQKAKEPPARKSAKELPARKGATADRGAIIATAVNGPMPQGNALAVEQKLRAWRSREAQARKVPAFCIFSDKVLTAIASERPRDETALLGISGIGRAKATKFGPRIFEIVRSACEET